MLGACRHVTRGCRIPHALLFSAARVSVAMVVQSVPRAVQFCVSREGPVSFVITRPLRGLAALLGHQAAYDVRLRPEADDETIFTSGETKVNRLTIPIWTVFRQGHIYDPWGKSHGLHDLES